MNLLSQSCFEAARLISDSQEHPLPLLARVGLNMHLAICRHCRRYRSQVSLMRTVFREYPERLTNVQLPDDFKLKLG
jgi:hypothetical protein